MSSFSVVKLVDPIVLNISGPSFQGAYDPSVAYAVGQSVSYLGSSYVAKLNTAVGTAPTNTAYWQLLAEKGETGNVNFPDPLSLELEWDEAYPNFYTEPTYDVDNTITRVDIYDTSAKAIHIFSKIFTFNLNNQITKVEITRITDNKTLTKDITYTGGGLLQNVTRTYVP